MSLSIDVEQRPDVVVLSVTGELDLSTAPALQAQVAELLGKGQTRFVFDLAEVPFCDSTGLSVFVRTLNSCEELGGMVRLAAPQRGVLRILQVSGLIEVFGAFPTVDEAIEAPQLPG